MKPKISILLAAMLLLSPIGSTAQSRYRRVSATNFQRSLGHIRPGASLVVQRKDGGWVKGKMVGANQNILTVVRHRKWIEIPRDDIDRVWRLAGRKTGKGMRIGAWIGGVTGAVAMGSLCHDAGAEKTLCLLATITMGGLLGTGAGAGIGAVAGTAIRGKRLVYINRDVVEPPSEDAFARASRQPYWESGATLPARPLSPSGDRALTPLRFRPPTPNQDGGESQELNR